MKYVPLTSDKYFFNDIKVVVVNNHREIVEELISALEQNGAEVIFFDDSREARKYIQWHKKDIVISTVELKGMNGYEMLRKLVSFKTFSTIFISTITKYLSIYQTYAFGAHDYINLNDATLRDILNSIRAQLLLRDKKRSGRYEDLLDVAGREKLAFRDIGGESGEDWEGYILFFNGEREFNEGDKDAAINYYKKAYDLGLRDMRMYVRMGMCYIDLEEYDKGLDILNEAEEADRNNPAVVRTLMEVHNRLGNNDILKDYERKLNWLTYSHPSGYVINKHKHSSEYLADTNVLFLSNSELRTKVLIDSFNAVGANALFRYNLPSNRELKNLNIDFIVWDLDTFKVRVDTLKSLDIPFLGVYDKLSKDELGEIEGLGDRYDLNTFNVRSLIEVVRVVLDRKK
jgi:CheY-like chemotaxis protein